MDFDHSPNYWILLKRGDHSAFEKIYRHHYPILFRYGFRICQNKGQVEQCIQNLFVRIWEKRTSISQVSSPRAYLISSLRREILKERSNRSAVVPLPENHGQEFIYTQLDLHDEEAELLHCREELSDALNTLPVRQREALYLKFYEELEYSEISLVMEINYQSVVNLIYRGIASLRKIKSLYRYSSKVFSQTAPLMGWLALFLSIILL